MTYQDLLNYVKRQHPNAVYEIIAHSANSVEIVVKNSKYVVIYTLDNSKIDWKTEEK